MNNKLWANDDLDSLDEAIEIFTVGKDYLLDYKLINYDIAASRAHASGLCKIGVITTEELSLLNEQLDIIETLVSQGEFHISAKDEDCHTAIEKHLTRTCGDAGKKIHTGRSRNDQILVATRLYMKSEIKTIEKLSLELISALENKISTHGQQKMPGYTHMQRAMPSSIGMWLGSFRDSFEDDRKLLSCVNEIIDQNPLGSVSGYGESCLGLDRQHTTSQLNFAKIQKNPMYCAMSRGKFELMLLQAGQQMVFSLGKLATDLMLFTTKEFDYCTLPNNLTTGSSAMPQKRNYDVCELIRGKGSYYNGLVSSIANVIDKLPSGYNRDLQLTKQLLIEGCELLESLIAAMTTVINNLDFNVEKMDSNCTSELYATEEAYSLVKNNGLPFRDAYHKVAKKYK